MKVKSPAVCPAGTPQRNLRTRPSQLPRAPKTNPIYCPLIPGGTALVGTNIAHIHDDGEAPMRKVKVKSFRMGLCTVTNAQFQEFVSATGYVKEAERFGWSFVFWSNVPTTYAHAQPVPSVEWWRRVDGANWREREWLERRITYSQRVDPICVIAAIVTDTELLRTLAHQLIVRPRTMGSELCGMYSVSIPDA